EDMYNKPVGRGRYEVRRRAKPVGELPAAGGGDPVPLLGALAFLVVGLDESVPLEALERGVDLPDVERPDLARPRLELVLQPQAVLRPLAQQCEQGVGDAHERLHDANIPSSILRIHRRCKQTGYRPQQCCVTVRCFGFGSSRRSESLPTQKTTFCTPFSAITSS